ncbi:MAG TPA: PDZ domain-containing protein [Candidatus Polarisedimenticolia bacterium]|nr:PDZ domain-containing protein [Candidatus Polarisedimenticolia bacterium]
MPRLRLLIVPAACAAVVALCLAAPCAAHAAASPESSARPPAAGEAAGTRAGDAAGTRMVMQPAINESGIVFVHAGDLFWVPRKGGEARRLTTSPGVEKDPHFSPDGRWILFTGSYGGNADIYVMPAEGGEPRRLTWHPATDEARGFTPDGKSVLFTSNRDTPFGSDTVVFRQLFTVPVAGGFPERLPVPTARRAAYSDDGRVLAYEQERWQDEWRLYRGGQAQPIRLLTLSGLSLATVPGPPSMNQHPAWLGGKLYFVSDRDGNRLNVYEYDPTGGQVRALTKHQDFDVHWLSAGGGLLAYEQGGYLHTLDPKTGQDETLVVRVRGDFPWAMPHWDDVASQITDASLSPSGARAVFEARGEIFTVPGEKGDVRNLTRSPGAADRSPVWSPDGGKIAWFSDEGGEYKLRIADQDGLAAPRAIAVTPATYFFNPTWSPDAKRIAFTDAGRNLHVVDVAAGKDTTIDTDRMAHPERSMVPAFSPDSRFVAYAKQLPNKFRGIVVYSFEEGKARLVTDGLSDAVAPVWDRSGKYLYFLASTDLALGTGWLDLSSVERPLRRGVYCAVLASDLPSPLLPESDEEKAGEEDKGSGKGGKSAGSQGAKSADKKGDAEEKKPEQVKVRLDFDGLLNRIVALPMPLRNYSGLSAGTEGMVFVVEEAELFPDPDGNGQPAASVHRFDFAKRKETDFLTGPVSTFTVSANGKKALYHSGETWGIVATDADPKPGDGALKVELQMQQDPQAEWRQIFREAWRFERDFFYVPNHHGADWEAVRARYEPWLASVQHRVDLSDLVNRMGGEHGVGHHFVVGGDTPSIPGGRPGLLGADLKIEDGRYRIVRIFSGESWNPDLRAPLAAPGVDVRKGDYLLAVNGREIKPPEDPARALEGTADRQTTITVNDKPTLEGARKVVVVPVPGDRGLRRRAWVEDNRRLVDKLSGGRLAYVWLPNTGGDGYVYFNRYYFAQQDRAGAILDERFNQGGFVADYVVDILGRKLRGYFNNPVGARDPWTEPLSGIWGPKVMLVNEFAGSGGDMLPFMFRQAQIGPLVGIRTWGGLVGIWDYPTLIDGGVVTVPRGGFFNLEGQWDVENKGTAPDIEVEVTPKDVAAGRDPQLERAVAEALKSLDANPVKLLREPAAPQRVPR